MRGFVCACQCVSNAWTASNVSVYVGGPHSHYHNSVLYLVRSSSGGSGSSGSAVAAGVLVPLLVIGLGYFAYRKRGVFVPKFQAALPSVKMFSGLGSSPTRSVKRRPNAGGSADVEIASPLSPTGNSKLDMHVPVTRKQVG